MKTETVVENGFKKTGIRLIPEDWKTVKLGDVAEISSGGSAPQGDNYFNGKNPFIRVQHIDREGDKVIKWDLITDDAVKKYKLKIYPKGTIVFPKSGASIYLEKRAMLPIDTYIVSHLCAVISNDKNVNQKFLFYELRNIELSKDKADGYPTLNLSEVKNVKVIIPSLSEQQKIAFVLSKIQQAVEQQHKIIETTRELKKSLLNKLFTEGLHGEEQKETEIGLMPKSWGVVKLGEFKELITKGSSPRWQGFNYCDRGIIFVRSQNVGFGELLLNDIAYLPIKFNEKEKRSIIKASDILINLVGASIGRAAVATSNIEGGNLNQAVAIVRLKPSYFVPQFLMYYLLTDNGQRQIHLNKKEIARANISLQDVNNFIVPKPEGSEQVEIVNFLSSLDKKLSQADARKQALRALFRTMLNQLMIGRIRVKDLDIEVQNNV